MLYFVSFLLVTIVEPVQELFNIFDFLDFIFSCAYYNMFSMCSDIANYKDSPGRN